MAETCSIPLASFEPIATKLSAFGALRNADVDVLGRGLTDLRAHAARDPVLLDGPGAVRVVSSGWVGMARILSDGRRQILQIAIAGDLVRMPPFSDGHAVALTTARTVDGHAVLQSVRRGETAALQRAWRLAEQEAERDLLSQITRLGAMTAYERTANLIVELLRRHVRAGLSDGRRMPWPVTQEVVSDILGLSIVHVNRVLQQLRRAGLIELRASALFVRDGARLAAAGLTDPV
jgi:CRP-like cAMP-binding protein